MKKILLITTLAALAAPVLNLAAEQNCAGDPFACMVNSVMGSMRELKAVEMPEPSAPLLLAEAVPGIPARTGLAAPEFDPERAALLAQAAAAGNLGYFDRKCYEYVSYHMEKAGVIRPEQWAQLKIGPDHAADFAEWAGLNKELMLSELKLYRIPTPEDKMAVPVGSILVYERGVCDFSAKSGHIEVVTQPNWACSDGCENLDQACFADPETRKGIYVIVPVK
ncbi:MAG: hypothetical protein A2X35_00330 [Elusimicrobia bacterium GWA2_61_42]|nr:MAG: hypothetical protein A2X35_00330 [Elusimicrobia bacterium GWA2_61_42]OGR74541.1 MAG: hypothetical protein A2X38_08080 [Elusimicrobia bacterium GWC2_61_25]